MVVEVEERKMEAENAFNLSEPITVGDYILKSKIGQGSFSTVWKAEHRFNGQQVAVKQVYLSKLNRHLKNCLNCELTFLSSVNHPNIIRLFDVFQFKGSLGFVDLMLVWFSKYRDLFMMDGDIYGELSEVALRIKEANSPHPPEISCIFLVLEFCAGGNLASYINQHGRVEEQIVRRIMQQLGAGLEILHSHHIIHRDLKPENILLSGSEDDMLLKIADFGLSRSVPPGDYAETVCGSPLYMAPEVLEFKDMMKRLTCGVLVQFF
ncbi:hypothetical protein FNV43_RR18519 [Rhamnella rubrinervis]|uniref:Protein kinase domain-containing protein n=1 Tax=Rhamnella rubrinervis TaxID=2594499 RepID=A0A8K0E4Q4_9ROSA|nr:hypothetical protein FNV43_RR18519 [Rhamnella rubrinervis]